MVVCKFTIKEDQLINLRGSVVPINFSEVFSSNNPSISRKSCSCWASTCVTTHMLSINKDPDSLTIIGSDVVQYNVGPSWSFEESCVEISITEIDREPKTKELFDK